MISRALFKYTTLISIILFTKCQCYSQISIDSLKKHVDILASDSLEGRRAGLKGGEMAARYLVEAFKNAGIKPLGSSYLQAFPSPPYHCNNIIGLIESTDSLQRDHYILVGAHYDHSGWRMQDDSIRYVYNGFDNNASGTAAIIEVGRMLAANRHLLKRSVIIVAFDAEETDSPGSKYFVKHSPVELTQIELMLSIDQVGSLNKNRKLDIYGSDSFNDSNYFMNNVMKVDGLKAEYNCSTYYLRSMIEPFFESEIPCLYVTTGSHSSYYKYAREDNNIDFEGLKLISDQIYNAVFAFSKNVYYEFERPQKSEPKIEGRYKLGYSLGINNNYHKYSEGPYIAKSLWGFTGGLISQVRLTENWSLQPELLYCYYGSESRAGDIRLQSVDLPLKLLFMTSPSDGGVLIFIAPYINYIFKGSINNTLINFKEKSINQLDWGLQLGLGIGDSNAQMNFNTKYGFANFYKDKAPGLGKVTNIAFIISIGYLYSL